MRAYFRLSIFSFVISFFLLTACKNEPKLPSAVATWDKTVSVRIPNDPRSLYFLTAGDHTSLQVLFQMFLPLANFDPLTSELTPVLIESIPKITEITEGADAGLVSYEYKILEEATWANGSPITGKDYLFLLKAMFNPHKRSGYVSQFKLIKKFEIDAENPKRFTIYSTPYMMGREGYSNVNPIPAYLYDPTGVMEKYELTDLMDPEKLLDKMDLKELSETLSDPKLLHSPEILQGSGPYQLEEWVAGQRVVLKKRANWWGESLSKNNRLLKAVPEKIIYKIIPDANAAISLMNNKELDIITQLDWATFLSQKEKADFGKNYNFYTPDALAIRMMYLNTQNEKLVDKKTRRALAHALGRKEIFNTVYYGYPTATDLPIYPTKKSYNKNLPPIDFNIEKSKSLLKEAGWEDTNGNGVVDKVINGERTELDLELGYSVGNKDYAAVATLFQSTAKQAGINIIPKAQEGRAYISSVRSKNFEMGFSGIGDYPFNVDPETRWYSKGRMNYGSFGTSESDALIQQIGKTVDVDKQNELFKQLYAIMYDEQPGIFICVDKNRIIASKKFGQIATFGLSPGFYVNEFDGNALVTLSSNN